ncbi:hypothetical protein [Gramella sp. AN32]|uniref:Uncharacterized protein n=1 Tax=Christiangramia antarctica TaxID=2058158 RepID=A0ABW5X4L6_9FLAO|nr:hypothetical protein [Gramella sp. AN32]MCM4155670.1 hypothetical protein [Gramella sp. AN32]
MLKNLFLGLIFLFSGLTFSQIPAKETKVMVRAQAKDAKFIGTSMGSARIVIKDVLSGEILAQGLTEGGTGDTELIMNKPIARNAKISTEGTAGFLASIKLTEPRLVTIEAYGPLDKKHSIAKASTQTWLIPGKDILGDGIILPISGFVVEIISPEAVTSSTISEFTFEANVIMMCGCPVTSGGMWNADQYEVNAQITNLDTQNEQELILKPNGETNRFSAKSTLEKGNYELLMYAFDPETGNSGVDKKIISID